MPPDFVTSQTVQLPRGRGKSLSRTAQIQLPFPDMSKNVPCDIPHPDCNYFKLQTLTRQTCLGLWLTINQPPDFLPAMPAP